MTHVPAIFQGGVFRPLGPVDLRENQRVELSIQPITVESVRAWLDKAHALQREIIAHHGGVLPDSTPDIAEDRLRDE
jgi:predicted DNA-binding antitoxin AbrB/MazE fold protein